MLINFIKNLLSFLFSWVVPSLEEPLDIEPRLNVYKDQIIERKLYFYVLRQKYKSKIIKLHL